MGSRFRGKCMQWIPTLKKNSSNKVTGRSYYPDADSAVARPGGKIPGLSRAPVFGNPLLFLLPLLRAAFRNHEMGERNGGSGAIGTQSAVFQSPPDKSHEKTVKCIPFPVVLWPRSLLSFSERSSWSIWPEKSSLLSVFYCCRSRGKQRARKMAARSSPSDCESDKQKEAERRSGGRETRYSDRPLEAPDRLS